MPPDTGLSAPIRSLLVHSLPPEPNPTIDIAEPADLIDPYPPMSYGPLPVLLALSLLGLVLLWFLWLALARHLRARPAAPAPAPASSAPPVDHRASALARIDEIEQACAAGRISQRTAHHDLSEVVRGYVSAVSGVPATRMTLHDLREARLEPVAAAVERTYPPSFGADGQGDLDAAVRIAREVVERWS